MRFSWKVCTGIVLITAVLFSVGGCMLIQSQFEAGLAREVDAAYEENGMLGFTLRQELKSRAGQGIVDASGEPATQKELLLQIVRGSGVRTGGRSLEFGVFPADGGQPFSNGSYEADKALVKALSAQTRGYTLRRTGDRYLLHAAAPLVLEEGTFYLENVREVTALFTARGEQYRLLQSILLILVGTSAVLALFLAHWLTKPLARLSQATRRFAGGDLAQRVPVRGNDEISGLSRDFNAMAERTGRMVAQLRDAARRQEDFTDSFAHELKTPLTSIIGYADMLRSKKMGQRQSTLCANYIFQEGKRLEALSMKLMELIVLQKQDFALRPTPARALLGSVREAVLPALQQAGISLCVEAEDAEVCAEPDLLRTVCLNLIDNARKAIDGQGHICLRGTRTGAGYRICVEDDGRGMEPAELSKITEAFYMVDKSRARAQGGAGLGLSICAAILALHGGKMEFASAPGRGTRVTVCLERGDAPCMSPEKG